ncbi:imidazole glycerol phosphate synthase subunit HisH [Aliikangiella sp. IMCC44359]|uniref:imidazole glycerol phosphate synthase subunit HisH n=1 Tax=Aliikangiella sp. IMCC44359 TaxID=3459125 RepID=UPI00403ADA15
MKKVLIVDTKAGNLFSLKAAIERLGYTGYILQQPDNQKYDAIVIPGQGRFGTVMKNILQNKWDIYLSQAREKNIPILGICVGMQIFFNSSDEDPDAVGLGWLQGRAEALDFPKKPMVGWSKLDSEVWPDSCVYFVNSYAIKESQNAIAKTTYGETFCAAIKMGNLTGVQFHPEKSSHVGSEIIKQALDLEGI